MAEGIIVTNPMLPEPLFPYGLFTAPYACGEGDEAEMSGKSHRRQLRGIFLNSVIPGLDPIGANIVWNGLVFGVFAGDGSYS